MCIVNNTTIIKYNNKMELGICYLFNTQICGQNDPHIINQYIIYETFPYNKINTQHRINRKFRFICKFRNYLSLNGDNSRVTIDIIKRIYVTDSDGNIVSCAIYYTYLLRIIQKKWRKLLEYRKKYLYSHFINHLRKREYTSCKEKSIVDCGLHGLFYR